MEEVTHNAHFLLSKKKIANSKNTFLDRGSFPSMRDLLPSKKKYYLFQFFFKMEEVTHNAPLPSIEEKDCKLQKYPFRWRKLSYNARLPPIEKKL